ncbi:hypothetical protein [Fodinibius saliphilus]|uniref:hypothetical protein n=1 Tax=Fodinibius saliphilus TaxID=1920650 RepID=UPI001108326F|nr:hypothetical protein [Fodinibius saliphilus]
MNLSDLSPELESELDKLIDKGFRNSQANNEHKAISDYLNTPPVFSDDTSRDIVSESLLISILSSLHSLNDKQVVLWEPYYPIYLQEHWEGYSTSYSLETLVNPSERILEEERLKDMLTYFGKKNYSDLKEIEKDLKSDLTETKDSIYHKLDLIIWQISEQSSAADVRKVALKLLEWISGSFGGLFQKGMYKLSTDILPKYSDDSFHQEDIRELNNLRAEAAETYQYISMVSYLLEVKRYNQEVSYNGFLRVLEEKQEKRPGARRKITKNDVRPYVVESLKDPSNKKFYKSDGTPSVRQIALHIAEVTNLEEIASLRTIKRRIKEVIPEIQN